MINRTGWSPPGHETRPGDTAQDVRPRAVGGNHARITPSDVRPGCLWRTPTDSPEGAGLIACSSRRCSCTPQPGSVAAGWRRPQRGHGLSDWRASRHDTMMRAGEYRSAWRVTEASRRENDRADCALTTTGTLGTASPSHRRPQTNRGADVAVTSGAGPTPRRHAMLDRPSKAAESSAASVPRSSSQANVAPSRSLGVERLARPHPAWCLVALVAAHSAMLAGTGETADVELTRG